jgi:hypothetical protein
VGLLVPFELIDVAIVDRNDVLGRLLVGRSETKVSKKKKEKKSVPRRRCSPVERKVFRN